MPSPRALLLTLQPGARPRRDCLRRKMLHKKGSELRIEGRHENVFYCSLSDQETVELEEKKGVWSSERREILSVYVGNVQRGVVRRLRRALAV